MFWLSRLNNLVQQFATNGRVAFPQRTGPLGVNSLRRRERVHLWLERLEDRRVLDATAVFSALGELTILGNADVDSVEDISFEANGLNLIIRDGGNAINVLDDADNPVVVALADIRSIQINLYGGNDQLILDLPAIPDVPGIASVTVNMGTGDDVAFIGSNLPANADLSITSESIQF